MCIGIVVNATWRVGPEVGITLACSIAIWRVVVTKYFSVIAVIPGLSVTILLVAIWAL